jgi:hypothetical protein
MLVMVRQDGEKERVARHPSLRLYKGRVVRGAVLKYRKKEKVKKKQRKGLTEKSASL